MISLPSLLFTVAIAFSAIIPCDADDCTSGNTQSTSCTAAANGDIAGLLIAAYANNDCSGDPTSDPTPFTPEAFIPLTNGAVTTFGCALIDGSTTQYGKFVCTPEGQVNYQPYFDAACTTMIDGATVPNALSNQEGCVCLEGGDNDASCFASCTALPTDCTSLRSMVSTGGCASTCGVMDVAQLGTAVTFLATCPDEMAILQGRGATMSPTMSPTNQTVNLTDVPGSPTTSGSAPGGRFWHMAPAVLALVPLVFVLGLL